MKEKEFWFRAVYVGGDDDYHCFCRKKKETMKHLIKRAVEWAKEMAEEFEQDLLEVQLVDGEHECFPEIETVWW